MTTPEYAVTLTYRCNWSCQYCAVRNPVDWKDSVTRDDVIRKLGMVPDGAVVTLFGGEPGTLPREDIELYMNTLIGRGCTLKLETNGLFARRFPDLLEKFSFVTYHCSQELDADDEILDLGTENVRYMIVIHDGNVGKLDSFLHAHRFPERFYAVEATYPHGNTGPTLSRRNRNMLLTRFSTRLERSAIDRLLHGHDFDSTIFLT